jgi:hypothetical protein
MYHPQQNGAQLVRSLKLKGRLSTIDLVKIACFVKKVNNVFNIKSS